MKKLLIVLIILLVAFGIYEYAKSTHRKPVDPTIAHYSNSDVGVSFTYPKILTASTTDSTVTLHHDVPFTHHDYCDFKGEGTTTIPTLIDFNVSFHIDSKGLIDAMKTESPYIPGENFVNGEVVPSPGFIDTYSVGKLKGYKIFEGAEGCGHTIYYFPLSGSRTLVVVDEFITAWSGAIDTANAERALAVPGVITKEKAEQIFTNILNSLSVN